MLKSGSYYQSHVCFVRSSKPILEVGDADLTANMIHTFSVQPIDAILWENQGAFKLIPRSIVLNLIAQDETARSLTASYPRTKPPAARVTWTQGIFIDSAVVKALFSIAEERRDSLSNPDASPKATGKSDAH